MWTASAVTRAPTLFPAASDDCLDEAVVNHKVAVALERGLKRLAASEQIE